MPCSSCNAFDVKDCMRPGCKKSVCKDHGNVCECCKKTFCDGHVSNCGRCKKIYCKAHGATQYHQNCKNKTQREESSDSDDSPENDLKPKKLKTVTLSSQGAENTLDEKVETLEIHHVDVGQGESTLIRHVASDDTASHILIDGGLPTRGGGTLLRYLKSLGIASLDYMICSHYDGDHYGGLRYLLENKVKAKNYWHIFTEDQLTKSPTTSKEVNKFLSALKKHLGDTVAKLKTVKNGDKITLGKLAIECIYADDTGNDGFHKQANSASLGWLLIFNNEFRYYTAGDLPTKLEDNLLNKIVPVTTKTHLCGFKAGHHGSDESTSSTFLNNAKPTTTFISCGFHSYRHPNKKLMDRLAQSSPQTIYLTNCFFNRKEANPKHTDNQNVENSKLKGRVAGSPKHLGTVILLVSSKNTASHAFHVGYYDDGSWGGNAGWRWCRHECQKSRSDDNLMDDRTDHVRLDPPETKDNDSDKWIERYEWEATVYGYRQFFEPDKLSKENQRKAMNKYKTKLLRFGYEDGDTTARKKEYIDAYEWLDELIWGALAEVREDFEWTKEADVLMDKDAEEEERNKALQKLKDNLKEEFNNHFVKWLEIVSRHESCEDPEEFVKKGKKESHEYFEHYVKGEYEAYINKALKKN